MFLEQTVKRNRDLAEVSFQMHQSGQIQPDSYVIDVDTFLENAALMLMEAKKIGIRLFFMLKQVGRNPYLAGKLMELGFEGAVAVDYREARILMDHRIPIANIGHLVQIPDSQIEEFVAYRPKMITVYSEEKISRIHEAAEELGVNQDVILRVYNDSDMIYSGQTAGIHLNELEALTERIKRLYPCVTITGVTSFPCFLYDETAGDLRATENMNTVKRAVEILNRNGINCSVIDTPSGTCIHALEKIKEQGGNCGEPGHGLSGTTPMHAVKMMPEIPCVTYVSEVSHNFMGQAYCYGGGYYRRSHLRNALVGVSLEDSEEIGVISPSDENIDYYIGLEKECAVGNTVIMAFRFQMFVTRSDVVLVEGLKEKKPYIAGIYNSMGMKK